MSAAPVLGAPMRSNGWLQGRTHDLVLAFIWVPFALAAHVLADDPDRLSWLVSATLVFSFAHQPLTLWLVYGDAEQRRSHAALFSWAPALALLAVAIGSSVQPHALALIAGVWNVAHTLRQRYGLSRLYGRLRGIDCSGDNRMLWSWLVLAAVVALARSDLAELARDIGLGQRSGSAIDTLAAFQTYTVVLVPVAAAIATLLTIREGLHEWRRTVRSSGRLTYLASTALLLAVLAIEPVSGFIAYVGAHAAEYLLIVRWRIGRSARRTTLGDRVGALARRLGASGTLAVYAALVIPLLGVLRLADGHDVAVAVALTFGALHLLYDGFIWRSPARDTKRPRQDSNLRRTV